MPSSFVARIRENDTIVREHKNLYGKGITPQYNAEKDVVQITFENHSPEDAETWLHEHEFKEFSLIEGEDIKENPRTFGYPFANLGGKFEKTQEGGLRVKGVKLLAAGTWTDSAQKTPCEYSPEILKQFAGNWHDNAIWSRHYGGIPRNITEKVGIVENPRFEDDAIVGDLYYHGLTQQSKDTIAMIENGLANYVSVETMSKDRWNVGKKVYQAQELGFTGLATVNQGACRVCKIRDNEAAEMPKREDEIVSEQGSLEQLRDKIRDELFKKVSYNPEKQYIMLLATLPDQVIYSFTDYSAAGLPDQRYRIPYQIDESGTVTFGEPIEVTIVYQDINEQKPGAFEQEIEMDEKALEAKLEAMKKELSESSEKKIKELEDKLAASETVNKELSARLEKVEKTPDPKTLGSGGEQREMEIQPVMVNIRNGTISRRA